MTFFSRTDLRMSLPEFPELSPLFCGFSSRDTLALSTRSPSRENLTINASLDFLCGPLFPSFYSTILLLQSARVRRENPSPFFFMNAPFV